MSDNSEWPKESLESLDSCPCCYSRERESFESGLRDTIFKCAPGSWDLYKCDACQSVYLDPRPDEKSIGRAYNTYFTHGEKAKSIASAFTTRDLFSRAYNGRLNLKYGFKREPSSKLLGYVLKAIPFIGHYFDPFGRAVPKPPFKGARLLDFGCGDGRFIKLAQEAGWNCSGIDFDGAAVGVAQADGLDVMQGGLPELERSKKFDFICLSHVIEHVHNPPDVIKACFGALNNGGRLWMETPNVQSFGYERYDRHWRGLDCPRHLVMFTPDSLRSLMENAGFKKIKSHPRLFVNLILYSASARIQEGHDTHSKSVLKLLRPLPIYDGLRTIFMRKKTEYIQLSGVRQN